MFPFNTLIVLLISKKVPEPTEEVCQLLNNKGQVVLMLSSLVIRNWFVIPDQRSRL